MYKGVLAGFALAAASGYGFGYLAGDKNGAKRAEEIEQNAGAISRRVEMLFRDNKGDYRDVDAFTFRNTGSPRSFEVDLGPGKFVQDLDGDGKLDRSGDTLHPERSEMIKLYSRYQLELQEKILGILLRKQKKDF